MTSEAAKIAIMHIDPTVIEVPQLKYEVEFVLQGH